MKRLLFLLTFCLPVHASFFIPDHAVTFPKRPAGEVITWGGSTCPAGTQALNGSSLLRTGTYANLFAVLGTTYGAVDGTHFTVPDTRGVFMRGSGSQTISAIVFTGTRGTTQRDQLMSHTHRIYGGPSGSVGAQTSIGNANSQAIAAYTAVAGPLYSTNLGNGVQINESTGAGSENYPANIVLLYCIIY